MENKKKKLIIGLILIIILGAIVFYLTGHLTKTTICKGTLDMITDEEVEVISSDDKVKETKTQVTYDYSDYMKDLVEAGLVSTNGSYKDIDYISLKDTIENQKSAGLTCKEK